MYVEVVPNRDSRPAVLLRESYRENGKVKKRTLANLTDWPVDKLERFRRALTGEVSGEATEIVRSLPHGAVAAVLGMTRELGIDKLFGSRRTRVRDLQTALVVARILEPGSKFASARALSASTAHHSLGDVLGLGEVRVDEVYEALDDLLARQPRIERALAEGRLKNGTLVLYDLTSTWMEGAKCPLAKRGYSRDGRVGTLQIEFGILTDSEGCPVAVEVFEGNTADPATVRTQIEKLRARFDLKRVVLVADRGMITDARLREDVQPSGLDWITALRAPAIKNLVRHGAIQLSLFEKTDLAEITHPDFPGERLVVCKNPLLAADRHRKRNELLAATETELDKVVAATRRPNSPLRGEAEIALRVSPALRRWRMRKHFDLTITEDGLTYARKQESIAAEAALDGIYVIRTNLAADVMEAPAVVGSYKQLAKIERVFRSMKTVDLEVRPIYHHLSDRVRAHVFLCMLAHHVRWHMERALAPLLFVDEDPAAGEALRGSVVLPARRSPAATRKAATKVGQDGFAVQSFRSLLRGLATLTKNRMRSGSVEFDLLATPTPLQARAFELLGWTPRL